MKRTFVDESEQGCDENESMDDELEQPKKKRKVMAKVESKEKEFKKLKLTIVLMVGAPGCGKSTLSENVISKIKNDYKLTKYCLIEPSELIASNNSTITQIMRLMQQQKTVIPANYVTDIICEEIEKFINKTNCLSNNLIVRFNATFDIFENEKYHTDMLKQENINEMMNKVNKGNKSENLDKSENSNDKNESNDEKNGDFEIFYNDVETHLSKTKKWSLINMNKNEKEKKEERKESENGNGNIVIVIPDGCRNIEQWIHFCHNMKQLSNLSENEIVGYGFDINLLTVNLIANKSQCVKRMKQRRQDNDNTNQNIRNYNLSNICNKNSPIRVKKYFENNFKNFVKPMLEYMDLQKELTFANQDNCFNFEKVDIMASKPSDEMTQILINKLVQLQRVVSRDESNSDKSNDNDHDK